MKKKYFWILILILILIGSYFYLNKSEKNPYEFKGNAFSYSSERGKVDYNKVLIEENETFNLYKVDFDTRQLLDEKIRIYGLLFMPLENKQEKNNIPSVIFLPGGGGTKESRREIGEFIVSLGYGVLIIDQRGLGETKGKFLDFNSDYEIFRQGKNKGKEDGKFINSINE